ncbi:hypothetical protein M409DRAFT_21012 [Zasmidium cellare ATCC 36951]|uniref:BTB domain-containing protein n=1 Tax=Zasmidium cellare ATCC 36951 TaxID=1080233 RepID=A0A6A6CPL5_ZASCE|nr:uncharacterized protein M409DRAFT_21012 [Zasmidium cellare ATCC 36951]KAF2169001.1 hypothetical protein M409DRAFT_21012 [Zasmidium cellare ATCC 36951]
METPVRPPTVPHDYLKNLEKLGADAASSDYTIACCGSEFQVHKQVVSLHSEYFARVFKSQYKESSTNRIDLVEDPKAAVESMVQYFYKFDYATAHIETADSIDPDVVLNNLTSSDATPCPDTQLSSDLQSHADIYTLADKYDIPGLKTLAKTKFESLACLLAASAASPSAHLLADFLKVIPFVYTHTAPNEEGLRSSIVKAWRQAPEAISATLGDKRLRELVEKFPELGLDLVKGLLTQADVRALAREDEDRDEYEEDLRERRAAREARRNARAEAIR